MTIVIVNYCTAELLVDCLASLVDEIAAFPATKVLVIDNASVDNSAHVIATAIAERHWSDWAQLIPSGFNGGFAFGNNIALRAAMADETPPDLFWMLNPDTRVFPGTLGALLDFFHSRPDVGIVGSMLFDGDEHPWPFAFRFPSFLSELERGACIGIISRLLRDHRVPRSMGNVPEQVDWVSGASLVVRRETLEATGLMDEGYFLYYEETDLCLKARHHGWTCWYLPSAVVLHIAGQSTGLTETAVRRIPGYWFDARRRYFIMNHGRRYALLADISWMAGHMLWRALRRFRSRKGRIVPSLFRDFVKGSAFFHGPQAR